MKNNKNNDLDLLIRKIEKKEKEMGVKLPKSEIREVKIDIPNQAKEALENIQIGVDKILSIKDWDNRTDEDKKLFEESLFILMPWFDYLKREFKDTQELKKAEDLVMSISEKHKSLYEWCKEYVDEELEPYNFVKREIVLTESGPKKKLSKEMEEKKKHLEDLMSGREQ